jgi:alpha-glucosidase
MLELYRAALALRRAEPSLGDGPMTWLPAGDGVLAFDRLHSVDHGQSVDHGHSVDHGQSVDHGRGVRCVVNISATAVRLPEHAGLLLASGPLDGELLPPDSAVWLRKSS